MATKTKLNFRKKQWGKEVEKAFSAIQTKRLIAYAENQIDAIGDSISLYQSTNRMDRTGNLLDSLCWAVYFNGSLKSFNYYRNESAWGDSHLHEWAKPMGDVVNGHVMAQNFIATYQPTTQKGWEMFFAVLAPYWGYWEQGHVNVKSGQFQQWSVMTQYYDVIKQDLSPTKVTFSNYIPS